MWRKTKSLENKLEKRWKHRSQRWSIDIQYLFLFPIMEEYFTYPTLFSHRYGPLTFPAAVLARAIHFLLSIHMLIALSTFCTLQIYSIAWTQIPSHFWLALKGQVWGRVLHRMWQSVEPVCFYRDHGRGKSRGQGKKEAYGVNSPLVTFNLYRDKWMRRKKINGR